MISVGFSKWLSSQTTFEAEMLEKVLQNCNVRQVPKGDFLLQAGQKIKTSFFVDQGLLRYFSIDSKGKEHILQFAPENWIVSDRDSIYFDQPSEFYIQALEDSVVILIDNQLFESLAEGDPSFLKFQNTLLHNHVRSLQHRVNLLLSASAEERYLNFIKTYPDIMLRVPQWMVASYLGVTPEGLSRVRRYLAGKD